MEVAYLTDDSAVGKLPSNKRFTFSFSIIIVNCITGVQ